MDCGEAEAEAGDVTPALRSVPWALASRNAHLLGINSISPCECGFPAAQMHFQCSLVAKNAASAPRSEWWLDLSPSPRGRRGCPAPSPAQIAVHVGTGVRQREVAGLGLGLSGEPRPRFAWQPCGFESMNESPGRCFPGLGEARGPRNAEAAPALLRAQGWGPFQSEVPGQRGQTFTPVSFLG